MRSKPTLSVATEVPVYPDEMEPLEPSSKQKMYQARFGDGDDTLDMLWVKPGSFVMGSPKEEPGRHPFENQHRVTLTQGFYLGKYEVTQGQYKAVMEGLSYIPKGRINPWGYRGERPSPFAESSRSSKKKGRPIARGHELPASDGGRMGIQLPCWHYNHLLVGQRSRPENGELWRRLQGTRHNQTRRSIPGQPLGFPRHARE